MRLLLDAHFSPAVAVGSRSHGLDALTLNEWLGGVLRHAPDEQVLEAAHVDRRVLVTYDCHTIPSLVTSWAELGRPHGGVILVDDRTIRQRDVGSQTRAILSFVESYGHLTWENLVMFLQKD